MAFTARTRLVNPRLGTYFGIFTAAFAALVLMALMFEQLGAADCAGAAPHVRRPDRPLRGHRLQLAARARPSDYFACGRRVPAFFNGLVLGISGARRRRLPGADRLASSSSVSMPCASAIGLYAGLVFMGVLLAPFVRKYGAYTLPTFLGRRFESRTRARRRGGGPRPCRSCCCWRPRPALPPMPRPGCSDNPSASWLPWWWRAPRPSSLPAACARSPGRASPRRSPRCWRWRCRPPSSHSWSPTCPCRR